ncbi:MAG: RidA family protein [Alphaproteobacteria bacterium]|jgi:hypothetical protein|nr:RidA family protein [Alphaproteobacteria bacterium]
MARLLGRLAELGLELPPIHPPVANYVGATVAVSAGQIWVSGEGPMWGTECRFRGKVGLDLDLDQGRAAARLTALNLLKQAVHALDGAADRLTGCVRLLGLVHCAPGFDQGHQVIAGAAELMTQLFGPAGSPVVSITGAPALPIGIATELDAIFTFR